MFVFLEIKEMIFTYQQPLIPLILSSILLFLLIKQSVIRKRFLKVRIFLTFFITFLSALILVFYNEIGKNQHSMDVMNWCLLGLDLFIGILFVIYSEVSSSKEEFNKDLFSTLEQTKLYVLVDRKNRIIEISKLFLEDLDISEEEALGKNLFDVIELKYRIFKMNDTDVSKNDLNIYFGDPETKASEMNLEIHDDKGDVSAYYFNESPIHAFGKIKGRVFIGEKKSPDHLIGMEKNLAESVEELDIIKSRFVTLLEKTNEGIFFNDLTNQCIWVNDVVTHNLCLGENTLALDKFTANIHPDDLAMYKAKMAMINNINPRYSISYRYNVGTRYAYVKEEGTRITNGKTIELCGILRVLDNYKYEKTQTELDAMQGEAEMLAGLNRLYKEGRSFQVAHIRMTSIADINTEYGRNIGNMALSEYIKLIKNKFVDANMIYRTSGLEFIAVITDYRKMEQLKNSLLNNEKILHIHADYGTMKVKIDVNMGICFSSDAKDAKDILKKTKETLRFCGNPQFNASYAYYRDIK